MEKLNCVSEKLMSVLYALVSEQTLCTYLLLSVVMAEAVFPPSVNWNLPQIADSNGTVFAYGAKNRVVVFVYDSSQPGCLKFSHQFEAHKDRITTLKCFGSHSSLSQKQLVSKTADCVRFVATAGDDCLVRVWNVANPKCTRLIYQHSAHKAKPMCLSWKCSPSEGVEDSWIASGDSNGVVVLYNVLKRTHNTRCVENDFVTCLEFAPLCQNANLLAVGFRNGTVSIVDTSLGQIDVVQKFRNGDERIENVSWCPGLRSEELEDWIPNLLSASNNRLLRFYHVPINSDSKSSSQKLRSLFFKKLNVKAYGSKNIFFFANWISKNEVLSGSGNAELLCWRIEYNSEKGVINNSSQDSQGKISVENKVTDKGLIVGHNRCLQSITLCNDIVITHGVDRYLCVWKLPSLKNIFTLTTIGGSVFDVDISPVSKTWLAVASGGGYLLFWNSSLASYTPPSSNDSQNEHLDNRFKMIHVWQGYKNKVSVVCFHPTREGLLAFGTEDGKVAVYDLCNNKAAITSSTFHSNTVYALSFGPHVGNLNLLLAKRSNDETGGQLKHNPDAVSCAASQLSAPAVDKLNKNKWYDLYSCGGEGNIFIHNPSHLSEQANDFNKYVQCTDCNRSTLKWNSSCTLLAVGNCNGTIDVYCNQLKLVAVVELHSQAIYHLSWQQNESCSDPTTSNKPPSSSDCLLAVSCKNDMEVKIVSLAGVVENLKAASSINPSQPIIISNLYCQLTGHKKKIGRIEWSPHHPKTIMSTSNDGSVQIWNVEAERGGSNPSSSQVATFVQTPDSSATCAKFSLSDSDLVYSGGSDFILYCWRPSALPKEDPCVVNKTWVDLSGTFLEDSTQVTCDYVEQDGDKKTDESHVEERVYHSGDYVASDFENIRGIQTKDKVSYNIEAGAGGDAARLKSTHAKKTKAKTFLKQFNSSSRKSAQGIEDTRKLFNFSLQKSQIGATFNNNPNVDNNDFCYYGIFAGDAGAMRVFELEAAISKEKGDFESQSDLCLLQGNVEKAIDIAIATGSLGVKHLAVSFMGGFNLWKKCVESLCEQSMKNGEINDVCQYLLMLNKVHDAMKLMAEQGKYKDAIAIGASRLPPSDEYLKRISFDYAKICEQNGALETAAQCYISLNDFESASRSLTTRQNVEANVLALDILLSQSEQSVERVEFLMKMCVLKYLFQLRFQQAKHICSRKVNGVPEINSKYLNYVVHCVESFVDVVERSCKLSRIEYDGSQVSSAIDELKLFRPVISAGEPDPVEIINGDEISTCFESKIVPNKIFNSDDEITDIMPQLMQLKSQVMSTHATVNRNGKQFVLMIVEIVLHLVEKQSNGANGVNHSGEHSIDVPSLITDNLKLYIDFQAK